MIFHILSAAVSALLLTVFASMAIVCVHEWAQRNRWRR